MEYTKITTLAQLEESHNRKDALLVHSSTKGFQLVSKISLARVKFIAIKVLMNSGVLFCTPWTSTHDRQEFVGQEELESLIQILFNTEKATQKEAVYLWRDTPKMPQAPPRHGDLRRVTVEVEAWFEERNDIATDWDEEGNVLDTTTGLVMHIRTPKVVYTNQPTLHLGSARSENGGSQTHL